ALILFGQAPFHLCGEADISIFDIRTLVLPVSSSEKLYPKGMLSTASLTSPALQRLSDAPALPSATAFAVSAQAPSACRVASSCPIRALTPWPATCLPVPMSSCLISTFGLSRFVKYRSL